MVVLGESTSSGDIDVNNKNGNFQRRINSYIFKIKTLVNGKVWVFVNYLIDTAPEEYFNLFIAQPFNAKMRVFF